MKIVKRGDIPKIKQLIQQSTLDKTLKDGIITTLDEPDDFYPDGDEEFIRCDLDICLEWLESKGLYNSNKGYNSEHPSADKIIRQHFKNNLKNFPYIISTEDFVILYDGGSELR